MKIDKPGLYSGLPMSAYLADPCSVPSLSSGCAHTLLTKSPFHAWSEHPRSPIRIPGDESVAMDKGSIAHALLLEGSEENVVVIDATDYRTKAAQQARDDARAQGKHPVLAHHMTDIRDMVDAARQYIAQSELAGIFDSGEPEATMLFQIDGTWCRARPDWINGRTLLHVKTTGGSARPDAWIRTQMLSCGYDVAAALYERGAEELIPAYSESVFFVIETSPPYGCSLVALSPELAEFANRKLTRALRLWRHCLDTNTWPCYPSRIAYAEAPAWALAQFEEEEYRQPVGEIDEQQMEHGAQA